MSDGISCTQDDRDHGIVCLTTGQSIGLAIDAEAGLISLTAVVGAFVLIFVIRDSCDAADNINDIAMQIKVYRSKKLVQRPMDLFIVNLKTIRNIHRTPISTSTACAILL
jgi:hypothetical protein